MLKEKEQQQQRKKFCPKCGSALEYGHCPNCGYGAIANSYNNPISDSSKEPDISLSHTGKDNVKGGFIFSIICSVIGFILGIVSIVIASNISYYISGDISGKLKNSGDPLISFGADFYTEIYQAVASLSGSTSGDISGNGNIYLFGTIIGIFIIVISILNLGNSVLKYNSAKKNFEYQEKILESLTNK